ncbi:hypothetical protein [Microbulbifer taiwanensis]|uniref:Transposase n=1 Tax=Microbulbifer taiwanensis TaxID=986746 RepID=A0ABW1YM67_9GAMM
MLFVLSGSRLMYVGLSFQPLDTETFIQLHEEAFRYLRGIIKESIYDQTKLLVIDEQYRELNLNQRFHRCATSAGYCIHACVGYGPVSKGKVEAGIKNVKQDALYGGSFADKVVVCATCTTGLRPPPMLAYTAPLNAPPWQQHFDTDERAQLRPRLMPDSLLRKPPATDTRRAAKTGLITWKANKYSIPMP